MRSGGWKPFWAALFASLLVLVPLVGGTVLLSRQQLRTQLRQAARSESGVPIQLPKTTDQLTVLLCVSDGQPGFVLAYLNASQNCVHLLSVPAVLTVPFAEEETIAKLEENVQKIQSVTTLLEQGHTPESLLEQVLDGFDIEINDTIPTEFYCNCSKSRVERALISIGRKELNELIQEGKEVELNCHFCNKNYIFSVEELKEILRKCK